MFLIKNTNFVSIRNIMLDVANENQVSSSKGSVQMVEECRCPVEYYGTSCQRCSKGFTKTKESPLLGRCELCHCYGHTQDCDEETGQCLVSLMMNLMLDKMFT